jgi:hypothetical protein
MIDSTGILNKLGASQISEADVGKEIRRFLSDAYSFVQGEANNAFVASYGLAQAVDDRINEIEGVPPFLPKKANHMARLNVLIQRMDNVVAAVLAIDTDELSNDALDGFDDGGVSSYLDLIGNSVPSTSPQGVSDQYLIDTAKEIA